MENNATIDSVGSSAATSWVGTDGPPTTPPTTPPGGTHTGQIVAKVQLYDCNGSNAQKWTRSGNTLVNTGSGKCLDATGNSSADGTRLQIWTCAGGGNQSWTLPS